MDYSQLRYNIFYLYNRTFYNCLTYGHLINNRYFKDKFKTDYRYLIDRSKANPKDVTREVADIIGKIKGLTLIEQQQIIKPYSDFFNSTANYFIKDDIIVAFDKLLEIICGDDIDSGLRNVSDKLSLSRVESDLTSKGIIFPSLFSDMKNQNLKELITNENKVYFVVNNKKATNLSEYLFKNSIDYSLTPHFVTDYSQNYNPNNPENFTYVADTGAGNNKRGFRLKSEKDIAKEHEKGYAVDTNINLTNKPQEPARYSQVIKKLMIMNYLYTSQSDSIVPYRYEISSYNTSVPHIHMDKTQNVSIQPSNGISLFKAREIEFMNGGASSEAYYNELNGKVKNIIIDMIEKTYIVASVSQHQITSNLNGTIKTETFYEKQKVLLNNDTYISAGELIAGNVLDGGYVVTNNNTIDINQEDNYNTYIEDLNEYDRLKNIVFSNGETGYILKGRDTYENNYESTNLRRSVEYLSYVINACIVEYFANDSVSDVSGTGGLYEIITNKIKVVGNFIVVEK